MSSPTRPGRGTPPSRVVAEHLGRASALIAEVEKLPSLNPDTMLALARAHMELAALYRSVVSITPATRTT